VVSKSADKVIDVDLKNKFKFMKYLYKNILYYNIKNNWNGNVILEYMFEFHDRMLDDLEILRAVHQRSSAFSNLIQNCLH
jgi:hypothetical protein